MLGMFSTLECLLSLSFLVRRTDSLVNNSRLQCGGGGGGGGGFVEAGLATPTVAEKGGCHLGSML